MIRYFDVSLMNLSIDPDSMYSTCRVSLKTQTLLRFTWNLHRCQARVCECLKFLKGTAKKQISDILKKKRRARMGYGGKQPALDFFLFLVGTDGCSERAVWLYDLFSKLFVPDIPQTSNPESWFPRATDMVFARPIRLPAEPEQVLGETLLLRKCQVFRLESLSSCISTKASLRQLGWDTSGCPEQYAMPSDLQTIRPLVFSTSSRIILCHHSDYDPSVQALQF